MDDGSPRTLRSTSYRARRLAYPEFTVREWPVSNCERDRRRSWDGVLVPGYMGPGTRWHMLPSACNREQAGHAAKAFLRK
jgi:hypothetical protein